MPARRWPASPTSCAALTNSSKAWGSRVDGAKVTRKQRRLVLIGSGLGVLALAAALVLFALRDSIVLFNSPTDLVEKHVAAGTRIRLGGLVKPGSLQRGDDLRIRFAVTDGKSDIAV